MSAPTGTTPPRTRPYCGESQPGWFGSFQIDQRVTWGNCAPTARTKSPYIDGRGRQVRRFAIEPPHRDAHAGPAPVTVRTIDSPRACAPATRVVSASHVPGGYAAGLAPSKPGGGVRSLGVGA